MLRRSQRLARKVLAGRTRASVAELRRQNMVWGGDTPAAIYHLKPSVGGKQPDGRKADPPVWKFAKANRFLYGYGRPEQKPGVDASRAPDTALHGK